MFIAEVGGIRAVVAALQQHPTHAKVQENGCRALSSLAANAENKVAIAEDGGIKVIVIALQQHPMHADMQEYVCKTLFSLAINAENKVIMAEVGVKELVQNAMANDNASARTNELGQKLLHQLAFNVSPDPTPRAKRWGDGLDSPAAGSRHFFPQGFEVTLDMAGAISSFGHSSTHVARIMHAGRIKASTASTSLHARHGAALYAYTEETPLYDTLNYTMRTPHSPSTPTDTELKRRLRRTHTERAWLQMHVGIVYRDIKVLLAPDIYSAGKRITCQAFSSSTKKQMATLEFVHMLCAHASWPQATGLNFCH